MGKLHKLRKVVLANPELFKRRDYKGRLCGWYGAFFCPLRGEWIRDEWSHSYANFVKKILYDNKLMSG